MSSLYLNLSGWEVAHSWVEIGGESENLGKSGRSSCEWENIPFSRRCFYEKFSDGIGTKAPLKSAYAKKAVRASGIFINIKR